MAQHDYNIANQSGADFRADLNNALLAIATVNSGSTEPSTTFAHQLWVDTSSSVLKIRNAADNAWITTGVSITASNTFTGDLTGNVTGNLTGNVTGNVTGDLTGNADSADILTTARTISLSGDVVGSASFDGSANIDIDTVVQINSITLGTDTTGDYVESLSGGTGVTVTGGTGEGSTPSIAIGQAVATTDNVTFNLVTATDEFVGDIDGAVRFSAKAGEALTKGDLVYVSGVSGDVPVVSKAKADDASKMPVFGLAVTDANNNAGLQVATFGTLDGLDTSGVSEGQILYASTTAGAYTTTKPTGESSQIQNIGKVIRSHAAAGSIKIGGAGRSNDVPNLNDGKIFIGNASNQSSTATLDTSIVVENTNLYYTTTRANTDFDTRLATKDTGDLTEGSNLYYTTTRVNSDFDTRLATKSTTDLAEGTNLYYTTARFDSAFTSKDTDDLSEGTTNLYYTTARFDSAFGNKTTSDLTEGTNLYYTDTRANSAIDTRVTKAFVDALNIQAASVDANSVTLGTDTVGNYVQTITGTANKITVTGSGSESANITLTLPDDVQIADSLTVAGNLTVNGTLTSLDTTNLDIEDNLFQLNAGLTGSPVNDSGMLINRGNQDNGIFMWDESVDKFTLGLTTADGTSTGNITLNSLGTLVANLEGNVTGTIQTAAQPNITSLGTLTGLTTSGDINFGDNDKAVFGTGGDLEIYHDGNDKIKSSSSYLILEGSNIILRNNGGTEDYAKFFGNGAVQLYSDNSLKLATTSTGIDVTGTVTADGLTVEGLSLASETTAFSTTANSSNVSLKIGNSDTTSGSGNYKGAIGFTRGDSNQVRSAIVGKQLASSANVQGLAFLVHPNSVAGTLNEALLIKANNDIIFYDDTGTTEALYWDASAESLFIGATSASALNTFSDDLIISNTASGTGAGISIVSNATNGYSSIHFGDTDDADIGRIQYNNATNVMTFRTNAADRVVIDSSGNLDVSGTVTSDGLSVASDTNVISTLGRAKIGAFVNDYAYFSHIDHATTSNYALNQNSAGATSINAASGSSIGLKINNSNALTVASNSNVGIGTTSPSSQLNIKGTTGLLVESNGSANYGVYIESNFADTMGTIGALSQADAGRDGASISFNDFGKGIVFKTNEGASNSEAARIDSSGRVGIGRTPTSNLLEVADTIKLTNLTAGEGFIGYNTNGVKLGITASDSVGAGMKFEVGASERARIDSSGNFMVGGTTTPDTNGITIETTASSGGLNILSPTTGRGDIFFGDTDDKNIGQIRYAHSDNSMTFRTNAADRVVIDSSGNFMVGKTSVGVSTTGSEIRSNGQVSIVREGDTPLFINRKTDDGTVIDLRKDNSTFGKISTYSSGLDIAGSSYGVRFAGSTIFPVTSAASVSNGAVDLGYSGGRFKDLYLSGTANANNVAITNDAANLSIQNAAADTGQKFRRNGNNDLIFERFASGSTSETMRLDSSGNVGIGTTSPTRTFEVNSGTTNVVARFESTDSRAVVELKDPSGTAELGNIGNDIYFAPAGVEKVRINSSGNVGIGTSSPSAKCHLYTSTSDAINLGIQNSQRYWKIETVSEKLSIADVSAGGLARMTFDTSGNVGIGTSSPNELLEIKGTEGVIRLQQTGGAYSDIRSSDFGTLYLRADAGNTAASSSMRFHVDNSEAARIDSEGNFLIGKTQHNVNNTAGVDITNEGAVVATNDGGVSFLGNRTSSDGIIILLRKDNTTTGSIGTSGTSMTFGTGTNGAEKMRIDSSGNVNIGGSGLAYKLAAFVSANASFQNAFTLTNNANADLVVKIKNDETNLGTTAGSCDMSFSTANSERMRIESDGSLLVGNTTNNSTIFRDHVIQGNGDSSGIAAIGLYNEAGTANAPVVAIASRDTSTNSTCRFIQFWNNVTDSTENAMGGIVGNGSTNVAFATISDEREKENITPVVGALDKIMNLNVVSFDWKKHDDHVEAGFIAQNVEEHFPEYVVENMSREGEEPRKGTTGGMSAGYIAVLTKAIQEQQEQIEALQSEINELKNS